MPLYTHLGERFDLLQLHKHQPERYPYLLESVVHGTAQARYDILFAFPGQLIEKNTADLSSEPFLTRLDQAWKTQASKQTAPSSLPFQGGWFLYLAYELAGEVEPSLNLPASDQAAFPEAFAQHMPAAVIIDHVDGSTHLVAESGARHLLAKMRDDIAALAQVPTLESAAPLIQSIHEETPQRYLDGVETIKRYIIEGDVFQVNLSRAWTIDLAPDVTAIQLYERLRQHNPAPFAAFVRYKNNAIISSSPERLVANQQGCVSTRPIAGTRPRGETQALDSRFSDALLAHPKERAEHVMLIDLERNDLGRICQVGSVQVDELMVLESYAHLHHIVSNVSGKLRAGTTPGEIIKAVFPGGTITGCPKIRCMEIIQELEQVARGPYTGSVGYLNHDGDMDLNILIRTLGMEEQKLTFRTGAGIVADSVAEHELAETRTKAKGLLRALGVAI